MHCSKALHGLAQGPQVVERRLLPFPARLASLHSPDHTPQGVRRVESQGGGACLGAASALACSTGRGQRAALWCESLGGRVLMNVEAPPDSPELCLPATAASELGFWASRRAEALQQGAAWAEAVRRRVAQATSLNSARPQSLRLLDWASGRRPGAATGDLPCDQPLAPGSERQGEQDGSVHAHADGLFAVLGKGGGSGLGKPGRRAAAAVQRALVQQPPSLTLTV